jgi:hypothetical protein
VKTPEQMAQNWVTAMGSAATSQAYKTGIQNCAVNPMQRAASQEAQSKYANATAEAVSSGRMASQAQRGAQGVLAIAVGRGRRLEPHAQRGQERPAQAAGVVSARRVSIYPQMRAAARAISGTGLSAAQARSNAALAVLMQATGRA